MSAALAPRWMLAALLAALAGLPVAGGHAVGAAPQSEVLDASDLFSVRVVPNRNDPRRAAFDAGYNQGYEQFQGLTGPADGWLAEATDLADTGSPGWSALRTVQPRIYVGLTMNRMIEDLAARQASQFGGSGAVMTWPAEDLYVEDTFTDVNRLLPPGEGVIASDFQTVAGCLDRFRAKGLVGAPMRVEGLAVAGLGFVNTSAGMGAGGDSPDQDGYWERNLPVLFGKNTVWPGNASAGAVTLDYSPCLPPLGSNPNVLSRLFVSPDGHIIAGEGPSGQERRRSWFIASGLLEALAMSLGSTQMQLASVYDRLVRGVRSNNLMGDRTVRFELQDGRGQTVRLSASIDLIDKANSALRWLSGGRYVASLTDRYWGVLERKLHETGRAGPDQVALLLSRLRARHDFLSTLSTRQPVAGSYWALDCVADLGPYGRPDCSTENFADLVSFRYRAFSSYGGNLSLFSTMLEKDVERLMRQATGVAVIYNRWPERLHLVYQEFPPEYQAAYSSSLETALRNVLMRNSIPCMHQKVEELVTRTAPPTDQACNVSTITALLDGAEIDQAVYELKMRFLATTAAGFLSPRPALGNPPPTTRLLTPHPGGEVWVVTDFDSATRVFLPPGGQCLDNSGAVSRTHRALPMAGGRVIKVGPAWVVVDHGDGVIGYYQDLAAVQVREGQSFLSTETTLGYPSAVGGACGFRVAAGRYSAPPVVGHWDPESLNWPLFPALEAR